MPTGLVASRSSRSGGWALAPSPAQGAFTVALEDFCSVPDLPTEAEYDGAVLAALAGMRRVGLGGARAGDGGARARRAFMSTALVGALSRFVPAEVIAAWTPAAPVMSRREAGLRRVDRGALLRAAPDGEGDVVVVAHQRFVARAPGAISASASAGCCAMCS